MSFPGKTVKELVLHVRERSPFYQQRYARCALDWEQLDAYSQFQLLPLLEEGDIQQHSASFRHADVPITRVYCSGGTLGKPKSIYYTADDWQCSVTANVKCLRVAGVDRGDVVAILHPFGIWSIGGVFLDSVAQLGAVALPLGIALHDETVQRLLLQERVTVVMAAPGNMCRLTAALLQQGTSPELFGVRTLLLSGEKYSAQQQAYLAKHWRSAVYSLYGSAETDSLAIACPVCQAHLLLRDEFLFELLSGRGARLISLDQQTPMSGELIVTTLQKQGTPLLRYRLGDSVEVVPNCDYCRGTGMPAMRILGRTRAAITLIEGTKVYGHQIERAIELALAMSFCCQVIVSQVHGKDALRFVVFCERREEGQEHRIREHLARASIDFEDARRTGVLARIDVECRDLTELQPNQRGKLITFIDERAPPGTTASG